MSNSRARTSDDDEEEEVSAQNKVHGETIDERVRMMTAARDWNKELRAEHEAITQHGVAITGYTRNRASKKNRFTNVINFDEGAIKLRSTRERDGKYIHASRVNTQFGNYVLAQGPLKETIVDWWRLIWQERVSIVVCLVPRLEGDDECYPYWQQKERKKMKVDGGRFVVTTHKKRQEDNMNTYELRVTNADAEHKNEERIVYVLHYAHWSLSKPPPPPTDVLNVVRATWALEEMVGSISSSVGPLRCPTLVHGSSGVRRTGALVVLSIVCRQLRTQRKMAILASAAYVRRHRFGVLRGPQLFSLVLVCALHFAGDMGLLDKNDAKFRRVIAAITAFGAAARRPATLRSDGDDKERSSSKKPRHRHPVTGH